MLTFNALSVISAISVSWVMFLSQVSSSVTKTRRPCLRKTLAASEGRLSEAGQAGSSFVM